MNIKLHIILLLILCGSFIVNGQGKKKVFKHKPVDENMECYKCHSNTVYKTYSSDSSQNMNMLMNRDLRIDSSLYRNSIHGGFTCTDCHSTDYEANPHPVDAKFETMYGCIDCHGGDKKFAKYHFEDIDAEYQKSVHATKVGTFTCWKCHNAHEYKNVFVSTQNIKESVIVANKACIICHENADVYSLYTSEKMKDNTKEHDWLPNQELHLKNVRCIDCHSSLQDSIATPHNIMISSKAVKDCKVCHSDESLLTASLYKYKMKENRKTYGFVNAVIMNDAYVIGANRNQFLNVASIIIFSLIALTILGHITMRFVINKKSDNNG